MAFQWEVLGKVLQWVWDSFGEEIKEGVTESVQQAWVEIRWPDKAKVYGEKIQKLYGSLRILGHSKPIPLSNVFTDVYIHDRPLAARRSNVEDLERLYREGKQHSWGVERVNGDRLIRQNNKLFILGQPGAGKTTFLKHIAVGAATGKISKVPVFVSLKELADSGQPLLDFLVAQFAIMDLPNGRPFVLGLLKSGNALILFDGLDEVTQEQEEALHLKTALNNFAKQYDNNQMLITCRTAATDYQFEQFTYVEMADFADEQIATFIHKWFSEKLDKGEACLAELKKPDHRGLYELARSPLLLSLLCLNYEETLHFPERRVELYEEAIDALLKKWDGTRDIKRVLGTDVYKKLSLGRKRQLFARIAASTFEQGKYFVPRAEMVRHVLEYLKPVPETGELSEDDGEAILRAIEAQHGILVERARGVYGFAHLTFQEYFTAKYVAEAGEKSWANLLPHCTDHQWREIFLLTVSLLSEADDFMDRFIRHLDQFVAQEPQLANIILWVNQRAEPGGETVAMGLLHRTLYVYLARAPALNSPLGLIYGFANHSALDLDRDLDFVLDLVLDLHHDPQTDFSRNAALDSPLALDLAYALVSTRALDLALDFVLVYGWLYGQRGLAKPFVTLAQRVCVEQGLTSLQASLDKLIVPDEDAPKTQREQFVAALWQIAERERQLRRFGLNDEQGDRLAYYLRGTRLLLRCLKLAAVQDREGIMARLLVPPGG